MSWLGKILTFLVLIGTLVGVYFTLTVYVTRTNHNVRANAYRDALKLSEDNRVAEQRMWQADKELLVRQLEAERTTTGGQKKVIDDLAAASKAGIEEFKRLEAVNTSTATIITLRDATEKTTLTELNRARDRNASLEDRSVKLVLDKETAERERLRAVNEKNRALADAADSADKVQFLQAQVTELRQTGGSGTAAVLRSVDKVTAPLPTNTRGTVLSAGGDFVRISIGIDAGLEPGSKLDIYRESEGKYLGTLVIQGTSLRPKEAVGTFRPASGRPVSQLRTEDLPRKGDNVGIVR